VRITSNSGPDASALAAYHAFDSIHKRWPTTAESTSSDQSEKPESQEGRKAGTAICITANIGNPTHNRQACALRGARRPSI